jgi:hypothetical protein
MAPLKDGVVVELGIGGRSEFAPMLYKRLHGGLGGHQRLGPRAGQATVQGDGIENFNADAPFERQPLDGVEAIELGAPGSHVGKIPARRGSRAPHAASGIQGTASLEDTADGSHRGHDTVPSRRELPVDRPGSVLAQITRLLELAPQDQHTRSSTAPWVRRILRGMGGWSLQSTWSRARFPARRSHHCTVARVTS